MEWNARSSQRGSCPAFTKRFRIGVIYCRITQGAAAIAKLQTQCCIERFTFDWHNDPVRNVSVPAKLIPGIVNCGSRLSNLVSRDNREAAVRIPGI